MQRDSYNTVTVPILIPSSKDWAEGETFADEETVRVREFTEDDADQQIPCGKETWNQISGADRTQIVRVGDVVRAMKTGDQAEIKKAVLALKADRGPIVKAVVTANLAEDAGYPETSLVIDLCRYLDGVKLVMWKRVDGPLAPGLLCPDARTAFWILTLWSAVGIKAGPRFCPKCKRLFGQTRPDQEYCSLRCREAHRVERWRERKKMENSSGKNASKRTKRRGKR